LNDHTVRSVVARTAARLEAAGVVFGHGTESAWDEAACLVLAVTGLPDVAATLDAPVSGDQQARIDSLLVRRIDERVPLPYLLGRAEFAGVEFEITPGVVIPRSPIGELILNAFAPWLTEGPRRIIDLCCGSGCIGIASALEFPDATLTLVDIDPIAIALTRRNVRRHGIEARTRVIQSDMWDSVPPGSFDLILCNPPYVDAADMRSLPPEYRHEPALGLAGGEDGMALVARLLEPLAERLTPGGLLVGEAGASAPALLRRFPALPFVWPDLETGGEGVFVLMAPGC